MGLFGKLFGGDKTHNSVMDHSMMHSSSSTGHSHSSSTATTAKDPICGMDVDVNKAVAKSEYRGQAYYFCSPSCKTEFDKDPARYASGQSSGGHSHEHGCC